MNIITADFNWISLLLIVGGAIFSIIKASKKDDSKTVYQDLDIETEDEYEHMFKERESRVDTFEKNAMTDSIEQQTQSVGEIISKKEEDSVYDTATTKKNEFKFDLRQAIISSEILRRPEY